MHPRAIAAAAALLLSVGGCAGADRADGQAAREEIEAGRQMAAASCASCHAIGPVGASPHPEAVPFRAIGARTNLDSLEVDFAEGIRMGHRDMPQFQFDLEGVDALLAYLKSVQAEPDGGDAP